MLSVLELQPHNLAEEPMNYTVISVLGVSDATESGLGSADDLLSCSRCCSSQLMTQHLTDDFWISVQFCKALVTSLMSKVK